MCGRVQTRSWETQSGSKRTTTEIVADQVTLLGAKNDLAQEAISATAARVRDGGQPAQREERSPEAEPAAEPAAEPVHAGGAAGDLPEIKYESEVKVEDLPF